MAYVDKHYSSFHAGLEGGPAVHPIPGASPAVDRMITLPPLPAKFADAGTAFRAGRAMCAVAEFLDYRRTPEIDIDLMWNFFSHHSEKISSGRYTFDECDVANIYYLFDPDDDKHEYIIHYSNT